MDYTWSSERSSCVSMFEMSFSSESLQVTETETMMSRRTIMENTITRVKMKKRMMLVGYGLF